MNYRMLGRTGLEISEVGFGAWGIGGVANGAIGYGPTDDKESKRALRRAYDLGVNFYDTSDLYGYGHSERLIGNVLKDVRDRVIITTKVGFLDADGAQDFSPKHIRQSLEASLKRLQTDYIDLYQLHSPSVDALSRDDGTLSALRCLEQEGSVRAFGISVRSPDDGLVAINRFELGCIQVNFNLVDQRALNNGLFDLCRKQGVGVIVRTPLCFGFLTGRYSPEGKFEPGDHRSGWSSAQIARWANAGQLFAAALPEDGRQTPAQMALRFCLSYPSVSTVIPGMLTKEEVEENVPASQLGPFPEAELQKLEQIYRDHTFFVGKD
jgi:aryl-alcohol dehydrogenase-like predicted oxidoreductase